MATVQVEGADELARVLRRIGDRDLQKASRNTFKRAADVVAKDARTHAPARSGRLRSSIRPTANQRGGSVAMGNARVPYAAAIHWGRKRGNVGRPPGNRMGSNVINGRPFLHEAAERKADEVADMYRQEVMALFAEVGSRGA